MEKAVKEIAKELKLIRRELQKVNREKECQVRIYGENLTETIEVFDVREAKRKSWGELGD